MRIYTYYPELDENDCLLWHVLEKTTQQIIESFPFEEDAADFAHALESGRGFQGFTPSFMLKRITKKDINEAFSAEFA